MNKAIELFLALVIIGATLAFGGVQPITYSLVEVALFFAVFLLLAKQTREGKITLTLPRWPVLFAFYALLQIIPLPALINPRQGELFPERGTWAALSIYPHASALALILFCAYLCAFALAAQVFDTSKRKSRVLNALVLLGCFEAAYGIIQYLTGWKKIFGYENKYAWATAFGTFINSDHFAGLLELTFPFVVSSIYYTLQTRPLGDHERARGQGSSQKMAAGSRALFFFFLLVLMMVAIIYSKSRTGIAAALFSLVFMALLAGLKTTQKIWMIGVFLFLVCVVGYGLWIGLHPVLARFEDISRPGYLAMEGRLPLWKDEIRLIRDHPILGSGFGTFATAFRQYQSAQVNFFVNHAHNDYLEIASETGLVGSALLFLPILYLFLKTLFFFLTQPRRYPSAVALGCIGSVLCLLIHSVTDFNLHIPANALIFSVVLGIAYKIVCLESQTPPPTPKKVSSEGPTLT